MSNENSQEVADKLYRKYRKVMLTRLETAHELGISIQTLDRLKKMAHGPKYTKNGKDNRNGAVRYSIEAVAEYIISHEVMTA
ncbi:MAG: hypothetical protein PHW18_05955 [Sulfuricurvum sp.]|uniref:hypothetical protein n=1 Tax=Sulfuricurvum sp. TaxID=2025608 RepID=UPI0026107119|nr:hypothetical protein [Sulfuricurvum sp.]MDD2829101.1 hypothetical protein [Sulfuricurvum sp.]MDD4948849.1 hypothetical protein [Sulfuricurvum sp.]